MRLDAFSYELPPELIAQTPLPHRSDSRLMVVAREGDSPPRHHTFSELPDLLDNDDVLVINRSRVIPARMFMRRESGGEIEVLFIRSMTERVFEAWVKSIRRLKPGELLRHPEHDVAFRFMEQIGEREGLLEVQGDVEVIDVFKRHGHAPLPPYIQRPDDASDQERYQTVFASEDGSVAAPTAGLHFDDAVLARLEESGVQTIPVVLHVGPGTFSPLGETEVEANRLQRESFEIDRGALRSIVRARAAGKRIVAVGTTTTRVLESIHRRG